MGIAAAIVAVLALIGAVGILLLGGDDDAGSVTTLEAVSTTTAAADPEVSTTSVTPPTTTAIPTSSGGYATALAAAEAESPQGWVLQLADESAGLKEYWSGPPQSEWVTAYLVEEAADGTWTVVDSWDLGGSDVPGTEEDEVRFLVEDFLYSIMWDDPDYAHSLTVEPFANDPASAQYAGGDFIDFEVISVEQQSDGTYWVKVEEEWSWGTDRWRYHAVPTEAGWRINDLRDW